MAANPNPGPTLTVPTQTPATPRVSSFDVFAEDDTSGFTLDASPKTLPPVAVEAPAAPKFPEWLKSELAETGLPAALTDTWTPEQATQFVVAERKRETNRVRREVDDVRKAREDKPTAEGPKSAPPKPTFDWGTDEDGEPYTDADIPVLLKRFLPAFHEKIQALEAEVLRMRLAESNGQVNAAEDAADRVYAKYPQVFGAAGRTAIDRTSPEFLRRRQCFQAAKEMYNSMPSEVRDATGMTAEKAVESMAKALFGVASDATPAKPQSASAQTPPHQNGRPSTEQYQNGVVSRPSPRDTPPTGQQKAERGVQTWLETNGLADQDATSLDEFI